MLQRLGNIEGTTLWYDVDSRKVVITIEDAVSANLDTRMTIQEICEDDSEEIHLIGKYLEAQETWGFATDDELWVLLDYEFLTSCIKDSIRKELDGRLKEQIGYVYFLYADNGLTKIGCTKTLDERIGQLTVSLPYRLVLKMAIKTTQYKELEMHLHEQYASSRARGEWFVLTDQDMNYIKTIYDQDRAAQNETHFEGG